jgi:DNA-binding IclR family transcriptional regulator
MAAFDPAREARSALRQLQERTGATVHFAMLSGDEAVYVEKIEARQPYRMASRVGMSLRLHSTSIGKAILAELSEDEVAGIAERAGLEPRTPRTITELPALLKHLQTVRSAGFAIDDEEHCDGLRCVCVPVRIGDGPGRHAIGISAPAVRADRARLLGVLPLLRSAASEAAASLAMDAYR